MHTRHAAHPEETYTNMHASEASSVGRVYVDGTPTEFAAHTKPITNRGSVSDKPKRRKYWMKRYIRFVSAACMHTVPLAKVSITQLMASLRRQSGNGVFSPTKPIAHHHRMKRHQPKKQHTICNRQWENGIFGFNMPLKEKNTTTECGIRMR